MFGKQYANKGRHEVSNATPNISGPATYGSERGRVSFFGHYLGVVKDSMDPTNHGRLRVYISDICGTDPNNSDSWIPVSYASPMNNTTPPPSKDLPRRSSGIQMQPVDINQSVIVIFINGDINQGFYIACVPEPYQNRDISGASPNITDENDPLARANPTTRGKLSAQGSSGRIDPANNYVNISRGLGIDTIRSPTKSINTPSTTFSISSPGNKIMPHDPEGNINPSGWLETAYPEVIMETDSIMSGGTDGPYNTVSQRTGGHVFRMEDDKDNEHLALVSRSGHTITMNDTKGVIYITTGTGNGWIELSKDGKIDIYSRDSISVRTQADFNFFADRDFNLHAGRHINLKAGNQMVVNTRLLSMHTDEDMKLTVGSDLNLSVGQDYILNASTFNINADNSSSIDAKPLFINSNRGRVASTTSPLSMSSTWGSPESFIRRIPMAEPWAGHEVNFDGSWDADNTQRQITSADFSDMTPNRNPNV